jgi:hypothetical protein
MAFTSCPGGVVPRTELEMEPETHAGLAIEDKKTERC